MVRGLNMGASILDKMRDKNMVRKSRASLNEAAGGQNRMNRMMKRSSKRSSFMDIILKKWTAPIEAPRQAMTGGVEGSLMAFDLHVHLLLWKHVSKRGNRIIETVIHALHAPDASLKVRRMGLMEGDFRNVLTDAECDATMVCVVDDFDVLLLDQYAEKVVDILKALKDLTSVEQVSRNGASITLALQRPQAARNVTLIFTGHSEDDEATEEASLYYPYTCARRREYIADQKMKRAGLHEAVGHVQKLCAKSGAAPPIYVVELLCVQEFQDQDRPKTRNGRQSRASSGSIDGENARGSLDGVEAMEGADAEALARSILFHQLVAGQDSLLHSLLCPVTHTHVLWDETVATKMQKAASPL